MRGYEISTTQCVAFPNGLLLLNFFWFHLCRKIRCCFFEFLIDERNSCWSLNRRGQSSGQNFCLSSVLNSIEILFSRFRDRSCVLAFSLVDEKKRSRTRKHPLPSLISALPDHHITEYIQYGLHFIRFGFTPAQTTTSSLEKFQKKRLRLRQGTVSYLAYVVF